ncbi:MAG: M10 family metallopeptidase C-terminal domain-containing protein [Vannielia sp.]|uniref:M10 family metallopeptidase C-terminal domain-containing protein n=1 Tax=Vannielia sp. TaxID=2813045 RepID=UPI003B8B9E33
MELSPQLAISPVYGVLQGAPLTRHLVNDLPDADHQEATDAAAGTGTAYSVTLGDSFAGEIGSGSDVDWVQIELTEGDNLVLTVFGTNGSLAGIENTGLALYDSSGSQLAYNDDAYFTDNGYAYDDTYFSLIEYTVEATGSYFIGVSGVSGVAGFGDSGDYILRTATDTFRTEDIVSQITEFGWGIPTAIGHDENTGDTIRVYLEELTAEGRELALLALEQWSVVTGITFEETADIGASDIDFDDSQPGAFAGPGSYMPSTGVINWANVNVGTGWLSSYGTTVDSYSFLTYMHEIGHALGLMHSGNYNGSATHGVDNHFVNDSTLATVMSYFDMSEAGLASYASVITPMIADIAAVWALYGTPAEVEGGDTTWLANTTVGGLTGTVMGAVWNGAEVSSALFGGGAIAMTVLDTGGIDTFDLSTSIAGNIVDLAEGALSTLGGIDERHAGNLVVIAEGTVIENALGGAGDDEIAGNDAGNALWGMGGDDRLVGRGGDDLLEGRAGDDVMEGDAGSDTLLGGAGRDVLHGGEGGDVLAGGSDRDFLYGGGGNDQMNGGVGHDALWGQTGNDYASGRNGNDAIRGGSGQDWLAGNAGEDALWGGGGHDALYGGTGNDALDGGAGNDVLKGGGDDDWLAGRSGSDVLTGGMGADTFVFTEFDPGDRDRVTDFSSAEGDVLHLGGVPGLTALDQFASLSIGQNGADAEISWAGMTVVLENISAASLLVSDLEFV